MNLIALMQPLSLIKHLQIHLQATCVFFCATSSTHLFLKQVTDFIWLIDLILLLVLRVFILLF